MVQPEAARGQRPGSPDLSKEQSSTPSKSRIMTVVNQSAPRLNTKSYLVGGGIAALASAACLLKDGSLAGENTLMQ